MSSSTTPILSQGVGYGIVLGVGLFFSALMVGISAIQNRYTRAKTSSVEEFTSASHSVKPGLIASGIVSAWTWAATLLQSAAVAYRYGISGAYWYAAGATVQILLFSVNASQLKMNAPHAHTPFEVIKLRFGRTGHATFLFFGLATNIIVSSMLITGGSATVTSLTGVPTPAACMLIPVGVVVYVLVGGMRSSLLADYIHTTALYIIILYFMFAVYSNTELDIGSPAKMYTLLTSAGKTNPIPGNAQGSYLTFRSLDALLFGIISLAGDFATVFLDQAYWQRAIASDPKTCVKAFLLGGSAWLAVPLGFASALGLAAVVLPGINLSAEDVTAGLPASAAASALLGASGAAIVLVLLFLAVTSATSAELIAVSSLFTFDIYLPYINPKATDKQVLFVDKAAIVAYGIIMGLLGVIFFESGIGMGYLYEVMGVMLGSAVCPMALAIMSSKANKWGCILGAWIGCAAGILTWLVVTAALTDGVLTVTTTFQTYPMVAGNITSIIVGAIISYGTSLIWPQNFDFDLSRALNAPQAPTGEIVEVTEKLDLAIKDRKILGDEKSTVEIAEEPVSSSASISEVPSNAVNKDKEVLEKAFKLACWASGAAFVILILVVPLPMFFSQYIFDVNGFTVWISVCIIWLFYGAGAVVVYPLYEARHALGEIISAIIRDIGGGGRANAKEHVVMPRDARMQLEGNAYTTDEDEEDDEVDRLTATDAYWFPVIGSLALVSLWLLFKYADKDLVNRIFAGYFGLMGCLGLARMTAVFVRAGVSKSRWERFDKWHIRFDRNAESLVSLKFNFVHIFSVVLSVGTIAAQHFFRERNWMVSNLVALSFAFNAISLLRLDCFLTGIILLSGLLLYDIWWVFFTPVMISVARDFDAPVKIVFPKTAGGFTLLGLGDIVLPGIFIALALRFDYHLAVTRNPKSPPTPSSYFKKPYFFSCTIAFVLGLVLTISVMHYFQAGQPALLYLSPACIGSVLSAAWWRGEMALFWGFIDGTVEKEGPLEEVKGDSEVAALEGEAVTTSATRVWQGGLRNRSGADTNTATS